jgi:hypothetical protein
MPYLIGFIAVVVLIALVIKYWWIALAIVVAFLTPRVVRYIRMRRYFSSEAFLAHKAEIASVVAEHNDVASYAKSIRDSGTFELGSSSTGAHAHLATFENTSQHKYKRDRNVATYGATNVHNCSLQVVRNAAEDPLTYLTKYFKIKPTEESLADVEALGESVARLEDAVDNLKERERSITVAFDPPAFILKHYEQRFMEQVGVAFSPIPIPYPEYKFEYVSAGGNSSQRTVIELNTPTIDELVEMLSQKIKFRKSATGQRALMTAGLRESIKSRDDYTCKYCDVSIYDEPHLLLEVDHIVPVSKGGLSTVENLQTLCWRCNRTKSNKIVKT